MRNLPDETPVKPPIIQPTAVHVAGSHFAEVSEIEAAVRIEDDVLITKRGPEVLTDGAPKSLAAIERLMKA